MELLYSVRDIVETYGCDKYALRNYIWKNKIGQRIENRVYLTLDELNEFLTQTELKNTKKRDHIYNIIKAHPSISEEQLHFYTGLSKAQTASLLADMSYIPRYKDLYEDDDGGLFVKGFDEVEKRGLFD